MEIQTLTAAKLHGSPLTRMGLEPAGVHSPPTGHPRLSFYHPPSFSGLICTLAGLEGMQLASHPPGWGSPRLGFSQGPRGAGLHSTKGDVAMPAKVGLWGRLLLGEHCLMHRCARLHWAGPGSEAAASIPVKLTTLLPEGHEHDRALGGSQMPSLRMGLESAPSAHPRCFPGELPWLD